MMHLSMSAPWTEVGSLREVTFEDFTVTRPFQTVAIGVEGVRQLERLEPGWRESPAGRGPSTRC